MNKGFNVMALDANYNISSILRSTNLQWNRKYYQPGTFSIEIPIAQYSPDYAYIFTKDRPEMGVISQVNYVEKKGYKEINLSGFFLENSLNDRIVYKKGITNILNGPEWLNRSGNAEDVAFAFFDAFKDIAYDNAGTEIWCRLGIDSGVSLSRGNTVDHERTGEELGTKVYSILKSSEMSYRVAYDFESNTKIFSVWSGLDRTQDQTDNNPVIFSTKYGNIKNPDILLDSTSYKNGVIVENDNAGTIYSRVILQPDDGNGKFMYLKSTANRADYESDDDFYRAIDAEAAVELLNRMKTVNIEFDAMEGSYEYMVDFDLGDKCGLEFSNMSLSANATLIGCYEVIKAGEWSLTLEFGTPILRR